MPAPIRPIVLDLTPYAGRWIAVIRKHVVAVGRTALEARSLAKIARPKEEPIVLFVPEDFGDHLVVNH